MKHNIFFLTFSTDSTDWTHPTGNTAHPEPGIQEEYYYIYFDDPSGVYQVYWRELDNNYQFAEMQMCYPWHKAGYRIQLFVSERLAENSRLRLQAQLPNIQLKVGYYKDFYTPPF